MKMIGNKNVIWFLALYFIVLLLPAYNLPLFETTEARYAEIAREMIVTGNYLEPQFEGVKHFHKPPFAYWMMVAGMKIFGVNGLGVRSFGIIVAVLAVFFLYKMAGLFFNQEDDRFLIALILASSPLFLVESKVSSTDIYLACFTIAAQYFLFKQIFYDRSIVNAVAYGVLLGLGFMTKGPVIFLFTILPYLIGRIFFESHRHNFMFKEIAYATLAFSVVAFPWYVAVIIKNHGLLFYFFKVQTLDRVLTNRFHRHQPFYFFFLIFLVSFFPHVIYFIKSIIHFKKLNSMLKALVLYIVVPYIVFQISVSKLATYILPFYGTAAIIAYHGYKRMSSEVLNKVVLSVSLIFSVALAFSASVYSPLHDVRLYTIICGCVLMMYVVWMFKYTGNFKVFVKGVSAFYITLDLVLHLFVSNVGPAVNGYKQMTDKLNRIDPERNIQTLIYETSKPSISFYRNKLAVTALQHDRYLGFQKTDDYKTFYLTEEEQVQHFVDAHGMFFLVLKSRKYLPFKNKYGIRCRIVFKQRRYAAYLCTANGLERCPVSPFNAILHQ